MRKYFLIFTLLLGSTSFATDSIYIEGQKWTAEDGKSVELTSLKGKTQIIAMVYTHCRSACPLIIQDIRTLLKEVPQKSRELIRVNLFSFDFSRESNESLSEFRKKFKLDSQWSLYRGNEKTVAMMAALLSVQYRQIKNGDFVHSNQIFLLDAEGKLLASIQGFDEDRTEFIKKLRSF